MVWQDVVGGIKESIASYPIHWIVGIGLLLVFGVLWFNLFASKKTSDLGWSFFFKLIKFMILPGLIALAVLYFAK